MGYLDRGGTDQKKLAEPAAPALAQWSRKVHWGSDFTSEVVAAPAQSAVGGHVGGALTIPGIVPDVPAEGTALAPEASVAGGEGDVTTGASNKQNSSDEVLAQAANAWASPPTTEPRLKSAGARVSDGDEASTDAAEEQISSEKLQEIKAKTMYEMIEELDTAYGHKRLLFLTNKQAELLSSSGASIKKMLDALEIPPPKLLINLLTSQGHTEYCAKSFSGQMDDMHKEDAGKVPGKGAFLSQEDERRTLSQLDEFMASTILPLAAQTKAVILCNALPSSCMLSHSLTRVISVHRSSWGTELPFSVISVSGNCFKLYINPDTKAVWRSVSQASKTWSRRDKTLKALVLQHDTRGGDPHKRCVDLDPHAMIYLMADTVPTEVGEGHHFPDRGPFNKLINELLRHLASTLPSLAIKTGNSDKPKLDDALLHTSSLGVAMDSMLLGSHLLFLDGRVRPPLEAPDRATLIENAKNKYEEHCAELLQAEVAESMDAMSIAYFHDVLFGDGDPRTSVATRISIQRGITPGIRSRTAGGKGNSEQHIWLHKAITRAEDEDEEGREVAFDGTKAPATVQQVNDLSMWFAAKYFQDAFDVLPVSVKEKAKENGEVDYESYYKENIDALAAHARTILSCRNFHHVNLTDFKGSKKLVGELVKLDRLPKATSLQGLLLLRSAWNEYDTTMMLADRYKVCAKLIFALQLLVAWIIVLIGAHSSMYLDYNEWSEGGEDVWRHTLFGLATAVTIITGCDSLFNASQRWHQLRSMACSLERTIWVYRTRSGPFRQSISNSSHPEIELWQALSAWREELVSAADLQATDLERIRSPKIYKHGQFIDVDINLATDDDYHTPLHPEGYLKLRIEKHMSFYQRRLPQYSRTRIVTRLFVLLCGSASAVLSYAGSTRYMLVVTSLVGALISWSEFSDTGKKIQRYSLAIRSLKKVISWWHTLSPVERAGADNISTLVQTAEDIIADEQQAWKATASRLAMQRKAGGEAFVEPQREHGIRRRPGKLEA